MLSVVGPRRLIHFSSVGVYGTCISPRNTFDRPRPDHTYGRNKLSLERYLHRASAARGTRDLVILRMGHVYGAEQWVSRFVFDQAARGLRLPFNGAVSSNAVHVANVAAAVRELVSGKQVGTMNLFDSPRSTWRDVFDWNTNAAGFAPTPGLDDETSEKLRRHFIEIARSPTVQLVRETIAWGRSLPLSLVSASPALKALGLDILSVVQSPTLEKRVLKRFTRAQLTRGSKSLAVEQPWLFAGDAPGPSVEYQAEVTEADARAVARWHEGYTNPETLAVGRHPRDLATVIAR
jgi:hypothetical protein